MKPDNAAPRRIGSRVVTAIALGLIVGLAIALVLVRLVLRDTTPDLTDAELMLAERRWREQGPASYNLELELSGNRPGKVEVEVRDGQATRMARDGIVPRRKPTWEYWTVDGQFDTIGQELDKADDPASGFGAPAGSRLVQRAEFDPEYGYPVRYHRIILGTNLDIGWKTTLFEIVDPDGHVRRQRPRPP